MKLQPGKIYVYDKIVIENQKKKRKYRNQRNFHIRLHLKDGLGMQFTACQGKLMLERALTSFRLL